MQFRHRRHRDKLNSRNTEEIISLTTLCEGEKGVITNAFAGLGLSRRLAEMGLTPGTEVRLIRKGSFHGPVEIEARGTTLALGYGVASKVFVRSSKAESNG
jgi:ferrous iron transport protein A